MRKNILFFVFLVFFMKSYSQKKYSIGIDGVIYTSLTKSQVKQDLFSREFGFQIAFRKHTTDYNYFSLIAGGIGLNRNTYSSQFIRAGYELGNVFGIKNCFVMPEVALKRYNSNHLSTNSFAIAPSIGIGYNLKLNKNLLLRSYNNFEYNIPNNIGTFFNNLCFGVHYLFD